MCCHLLQQQPMPQHGLSRAYIRSVTHCCLCRLPFAGPDARRVVDHNHQDGTVVGVAHPICNVLRRRTLYVPCISHNGHRFDNRFVLCGLASLNDPRLFRVDILPNGSLEHYRTVTVNNYRLIDLYKFLPASLETLVNNLRRRPSCSWHLLDLGGFYDRRDEGDETAERKKTLLLRKGVFPYEYVKGVNMLEATPHVLHIDHFYSALTGRTITPEDHLHAVRVFSAFRCANMMDYARLYVRLDCYLLA